MVWLAIIGSASIQIRADDKYFEPDVQRAVKRIKNVAIQLKADVDLTKASKKIRDLRYRITSKDAVLKVDANTAKAEARMAKFLAKFVDKNMEYTATANVQGANTALTQLRDRFKNTRIPFTAQADTAAARAQLSYAARNRTSTISARVDPATMAAVVGLFNTLTGTLPMEKIKGVLTGIAANFEGMATKAAIAATAIGAVSAALGTTGANILSVGADITETIGLLAVFPAALFAMQMLLKTNKLAWENFGTAAADNSKKANEALAKLPPEAQAAAKALRGVKEEIQKPVQGAFWEAVGTSLQDMVAAQLPSVKRGLTDIADAMGSFSAEFFNTIKDIGDFNDIFGNIANSVRNMIPAIKPATEALATFIGTGSQYLPRFGEWVTELANKFGDFTRKAQESGRINVWIEDGIRRLQEMGSIVKSTTQILGGLAEAAKLSGAPGLTEMAAGMRNIADIVNGEPFQSRLVTILEGARVGTEALGQGFKDLAGFVGESSSAIGIFLAEAGEIGGVALSSVRALFDGTNFGSGTINAMKGLNEALVLMEPGFSDLGDAIGHLGDIAGELFRNMAPGLNQIFDTVEKVLAALKDGIIDAMPVFNEFVQAILTLVQGPIVFLAEQIGNMLTAFSNLPGAIQTVLMSLGLFLLLKNKFVGFFSGISDSLNNEKTSIGQAYTGITEGARQTRAGVADSFSTLGAAMKNALVTSAEAGSKAFSPIIGRAEEAADGVRRFGDAFRQGLSLGPELETVKTGFQNLGTNISQTARGMGDTLKGVGQDIVKAIIPEGIRNAAANVHNDLAPAREAFSNLVPAAGEAGRQAGSALGNGLRTASSGLVSALGGAWGIALAGATVALGIFAAEQAEAEGKISSLSATLDEQSGEWNKAARKMFAAEVLDQNANWWDDLARSGRRNMEELVRDTDMNMTKVMDTLTDPKGRDAFVDNWRKIRDAAGDGKDVNEELAASVGMTKQQLEGLSQTDLENLTRQFEKSAKLAADAEQRTIALAKATGSNNVEAAALAANYDTLGSSTSSLDDKFRAFKQNLDITTGGFQELKNGTRDFKESMFNMEDSVLGVGEKYKGVVAGTVEGTKVLSESFRAAMFNADGTFSTASREAIEFSKQMDTARDAVLKAGITEFQALRDAGVELPEAQAQALAKMEPMLQSMRDGLGRLGFDSAQVNQIMGQLGLDPDKLRGALALDTQDAEGKAQRLAIMLQAISNGNFSVALAASSDQVKEELLKVKAYKDAYEKDGWKGVVDLVDKAGPKADELLLKLAQAKDLEDIKKIIDVEAKGLPKVEEMTGLVTDFGYIESKATLGIEDHALVPTQTVKKEVEGLNGTVGNATVKATDEASPVIAGVEASASTFAKNPANKDITATDKTTTAVESAKTNMGSLPDVIRGLFAKDATLEERNAAQTTMNGLLDVTRSLFGNNAAAGGTHLAQGTMNSLLDVTRALFANNQTEGGRSAAQGNIDRNFNGKSVDLKANDQASSVVTSINQTALTPKTLSIGAVISGISAAARIALGLANGGVIGGDGVKKFADGGILKRAQAPAIKAFAGGGIENHTAQIARGAWPVRVWAEPETGGEAYIPLSKNKRKRSLEILRQVMDEFGLAHLAQFADGGIMKSMPSSPRNGTTFSGFRGDTGSVVTRTAGTTAAPTIVTNVYPSQGLNEEQVADSVSENIYWRLSTKI